MEKKKNGLRLYVILVFVLTWTYMFTVCWPAAKNSSAQIYQLTVAGCMAFPAACMLLTRILTREGFGDLLIRPRFRGNIKTYLLAYFGPGVLVILGSALYFLVFPGKLDWSAPMLRQQMAAAGNPYEAQTLPMSTILTIQTVQVFLIAGLVNLIPSLGEEWGWRGYMMPRLMVKMKPIPALLLGGVIWGLWHAPIIALGHNYGTGYPGWPWAGIAMMCLYCTAFGILLTWLTEKSGSCIPAAIAHGAFNGSAALGTVVSTDGGNPFVGPAPMGFLGGLPIVAAAAAAAVWFVRRRELTEDCGAEQI